MIPWAVAAAAVAAGGSIIAGSQQSKSAKSAANTNLDMYKTTRNDLMPYNLAGQAAMQQLMQYWGLGSIQPGTTTTTPGQTGPQINMLGSGLLGPNVGAIGRMLGSPTTTTTTGPTWNPGTPSGANAFEMLKNYPGYQFQYGQGLEALNRNLSAGGRYTSGAMMKDAQTYGQGQAESAVTNYLQMLQYLGTLGQNSAAQTGSLGAQAAFGAAGSRMAGGSASASGTMGAANALGGLVQNGSFQNLFAPSYASYDGTNWNPGRGGFPVSGY